MTEPRTATSTGTPNGSGAAAILAAGIGNLSVALFAIAGDEIASVKSVMTFYKPTGPLSGVTTSAILVWLAIWLILEVRWRRKDVALPRINAIAFALLALSLLLTFPPIADMF